VIQVIDDWFTNYRLGLLLEAKVGKGRLMISAIDFTASDLDPVTNQLRSSVLAYMNSASFSPPTTLSREQLQSIVPGR